MNAPTLEFADGSRPPITLAAETVIGRGPDATFNLAAAGVADLHARIIVDSRGAAIEDLGTRTGTLLNGERVDGLQGLSDGDRIDIGAATLVFKKAVKAAVHAPAPSKLDEKVGAEQATMIAAEIPPAVREMLEKQAAAAAAQRAAAAAQRAASAPQQPHAAPQQAPIPGHRPTAPLAAVARPVEGVVVGTPDAAAGEARTMQMDAPDWGALGLAPPPKGAQQQHAPIAPTPVAAPAPFAPAPVAAPASNPWMTSEAAAPSVPSPAPSPGPAANLDPFGRPPAPGFEDPPAPLQHGFTPQSVDAVGARPQPQGQMQGGGQPQMQGQTPPAFNAATADPTSLVSMPSTGSFAVVTDPIPDKEKVMMILAYLIAWIPYFFVKDKSDGLKWHARQGMALLIAAVVFSIAFNIVVTILAHIVVFLAVLFGYVGMLINLGIFVVMVLGILKALKGVRWPIPVISQLAEKLPLK